MVLGQLCRPAVFVQKIARVSQVELHTLVVKGGSRSVRLRFQTSDVTLGDVRLYCEGQLGWTGLRGAVVVDGTRYRLPKANTLVLSQTTKRIEFGKPLPSRG